MSCEMHRAQLASKVLCSLHRDLWLSSATTQTDLLAFLLCHNSDLYSGSAVRCFDNPDAMPRTHKLIFHSCSLKTAEMVLWKAQAQLLFLRDVLFSAVVRRWCRGSPASSTCLFGGPTEPGAGGCGPGAAGQPLPGNRAWLLHRADQGVSW